MKKFLITYILSLIVICSYSTQYEYNTYGTSGSSNINGSPYMFGQTFTVGATSTNESFVIDSLRVTVNRTANYIVKFAIYAVSGGYPTGSALSTGQIPADGVQIYNRMVTMSPAALSASTQYAIVIYSDDVYTSLFQPWYSVANNYTGGISISYNGATWSEHSSNWDLNFNVYGKHAPIITTNPVSITRCVGTSATFSVVVDSDSPTYQWRKGGSNISGATSSSYNIPSVVSGSAGSYDCVVTESLLGTTTTSSAATLTVPTTTSITSQPSSISRCVGTSATFSVTATGESLTYQWKKNGTNISETGTSFTISSVTTGDAADYTVVVTGTCGTVTSSTATLTVNTSPNITVQPISQEANLGDNIQFSVTATGTGLSYQWRKNGTNIGGATSSIYTISYVTSGDAGSYSCYITGTCSNTLSSSATLTIASCPNNMTTELDGYWEFNETTGSVATDIHSNLDGTIGAGVTLGSSGILGTAFSFNRTLSTSIVTLSLTDPLLMFMSYDFSIELWAYPTEFTTSQRGLVGGEIGAFTLYISGVNGELAAAKNDVEGITSSGLYLTLNQWNHIIVTRDFSESKLTYYLNGVQSQVTYSGSFTSGASTYIIGAINPGSNVFQGRIDEVAFYRDRVLSGNEITCSYNGGLGWEYPFEVSTPPPSSNPRKKILLASKLRNILLADIARDFGEQSFTQVLSESYGYDSTYVLSVTQKYAIPENVSNGDYVGVWQKTLTWMSGNTVTYAIETNHNGAFAINSTSGLITIADYTKLNGKISAQDTVINLIIRSTDAVMGYELDTAEIRVKENSYCKFYDFAGAGTGTRANPYNDLDDVALAAGYGYFLKRGTTVNNEITTIYSISATEAHPTIFAAYDQGNKPILNGTSQTISFLIGSGAGAQSSYNISFYDLLIENYESTALFVYPPSDNIGIYNVDFDNNGTNPLTSSGQIVLNDLFPDYLESDSSKVYEYELINLTIDNTNYPYTGIKGCPHSVQNCYFGSINGITGSGSYHMRISQGTSTTVSNCYFEEIPGTYAARDYAHVQLRADKTTFESCYFGGFGSGLYVTYPGGEYYEVMPDSVHVNNCLFRNMDYTAIAYSSGEDLTFSSVGNIIENSRFDNVNQWLYLRDLKSSIFRRNIVRGYGTTGTATYEAFVNNSFYYNVVYGFTGDQLYISLGSGTTIYNNTIDGSINCTGATTETARNNYYRSIISVATNTNYVDLDLIDVTDHFVDYTSRNYTLKSTASLAIDGGYDLTGIGLTKDLVGTDVPQYYGTDIGAYEYVIDPLTSERRYYISNDGDDNNSGSSPTYPWATISKVNSTTLHPGDTVLFKGGDTFEGELIINDAGKYDSTIVIKSYGGGMATISGLRSVSSWSVYSGSINRSSLTVQPGNVFRSGSKLPHSRWPNTAKTYSYPDNSGSSTSIVDAAFDLSRINDGTRYHIRTNLYWLNHGVVSDYNSGTKTLTISSISNGTTQTDYGFYLTGAVKAINADGEWGYVSDNDSLYVWGSTTGIKASYYDKLIDINSTYITIDSLIISGSNDIGIDVGADNVSIKDCTFEYNFGNSIIATNSDTLIIDNNTIQYNDATPITIDYSDNIEISNNYLFKNGTDQQDGDVYNDNLTQIDLASTANAKVFGNVIDYSPRSAIFLFRNEDRKRSIYNNLMNHSMLSSADGGAIYTAPSTTNVAFYDTIRDNIIINTPGSIAGTPSSTTESVGIYIDNPPDGAVQENWHVLRNFVDSTQYGVYVHKARNIICDTNTLAFCDKAFFNVEFQQATSDYRNTGITTRGNSFICDNTHPYDILVFEYTDFTSATSGLNSFTDPSQSYYMHYYNVPTVTDDYYTIADLQGYGGEIGSAYYDMNGGYSDPEVFYNASNSNVLIDIDTDNYYYKDNKENTISADFTLLPYQTKILYKLAK